MRLARMAFSAAVAGVGMILSGASGAVAFITVQSDGTVSVRMSDQPPILVPAATAQLLRGALMPGADPALVEALLADRACIAPNDAAVTAAVATYALSLAPVGLSEAVVAGALSCNPDASDGLEVAAGPETPNADVGLADLGTVGGISGAGSQELPRTGSPNQL